uniref:Uncharacterized protein n=1 Tax=Oryza meridionalis TaxID=40149 RepID=A0A0E0C9T0_9ORYZ
MAHFRDDGPGPCKPGRSSNSHRGRPRGLDQPTINWPRHRTEPHGHTHSSTRISRCLCRRGAAALFRSPPAEGARRAWRSP